MTLIYVPRLIESAEQAEALPEGTVVRWEDVVGVVLDDCEVQVFGEDAERPVETLVGWTALVPIEAEEETHGYIKYGRFGGEDSTGTRTRLVTPWEETP